MLRISWDAVQVVFTCIFCWLMSYVITSTSIWIIPVSYFYQNLLVDEPGVTLLDVDFCDTHMVLILKKENKFRLCSVKLPLPSNIKVCLFIIFFSSLFFVFENN
jgi:hypothetical protein